LGTCGVYPRGFLFAERAARLGLSGAMITEYPAEHRRYDQPEYEPFCPELDLGELRWPRAPV
jgi:hypothetical protein